MYIHTKMYIHIHIHTLNEEAFKGRKKIWIQRNQTWVKAGTEANVSSAETKSFTYEVWPNIRMHVHACTHTLPTIARHQRKHSLAVNGKQKPQWLISVLYNSRHHTEQNKNGQGTGDRAKKRKADWQTISELIKISETKDTHGRKWNAAVKRASKTNVALNCCMQWLISYNQEWNRCMFRE